MKRHILLLAAILLGSGLNAQNTVIDTRPAHDGALLSMEQVILRRACLPYGYGYWQDDESFLAVTGEGSFKGSVTDPSLKPWVRDRMLRPQDPVFDMGPAGHGVRVEGRSFVGKKAGEEAQFTIAESTDPNISFGGTAMRNEFGFSQGYTWSPSGEKVAFYRKDETWVTSFPLLDIQTRTGELKRLKYPMNGMDSEVLQIGVYNFNTGETAWLDVTDFTPERYITNLSWSPDDQYLFAQVVSRDQHQMHLNQYRSHDGSFVRTLLTEENDAWIEPLDPIWFLKGRTDVFLYRTDNRDGFRLLYLVDTLGTVRRLTTADADIAYLDNDGTNVYYTSAELSPIQNHLFKVSVKLPKKQAVKKARFSKPQQLTSGRGWHDVSLNKSLTWFIDRCSNLNLPAELRLCSTDGKKSVLLHAEPDPLEGIASCQVELGTVPSADGAFQNYYRLIYPKDFDPARKYPVIVYVYGGPHSQMVQDSWLAEIRPWEMLMAQKGYLVYIQDNRGTQNRGAAFEKAINRQCGQAEMEDQMVGVNRLLSLPYVDAQRIGVHGWSYGGFMTISLMTHYPEVFQVGVAGGPVIDWKWYEIMYGERYMDNPETNPEGFEKTSLINWAGQLKGKLLICQGAVDDTVVWEHSLSFIQECIKGWIPVDYFPYPVAKHNVTGRDRVHLMDKVTQYFEDYL